jgi:hypothetical protein
MVQEGLSAPSLCLLKQKPSWRLLRKKMHVLFMFFPHQMLNHVHMRFLLSTKNSKMCLRKKMRTLGPNINHMTIPFDFYEGVQPPFKPIYKLSQNELTTFHEYIDKNLKKRFIWYSKSLISAAILFVKKKDGSFQMCVDYRGLNQLTIKNRYLLPLISKLLDQLNHVKVYTKIDLCGAYNLVHIWKGDEWKTTFKTYYVHFKYVVMPFGVTNTLVVFQHLMNDFFHEYFFDFMICYIDDIFIFSKNMEGYECHVRLVLEKF